MAATVRRLLTNFSKGELSPLLEGRPDLTAYFEGGRRIENFTIMRQGGLRRRYGTRFLGEAQVLRNGLAENATVLDAVLWPFEAGVEDSFVVVPFRDSADMFARLLVWKNTKVNILDPNDPTLSLAVVAQFVGTQAREAHFTQSVDVMKVMHEKHTPKNLSRFADQDWTFADILFKPRPSFEDDTDLSAGGTITVTFSGSTGTVTVTASSAVFLAGDVGRVIIAGPEVGFSTGQARITGFISSTVVTAIVDQTVTANQAYSVWKLRLSPQTVLDPNKKEPAGVTVTCTTGAVDAFRSTDVGKFIKVYAGVIEITAFTSATSVDGIIRVPLSGTASADPPAALAGTWTLERASWPFAAINAIGNPRTGEFYAGRFALAATNLQPTTWWLSAPDDYDNFGVGVNADEAVEFTMASRQLNRIEWLADNRDLFIGTAGSEHRAEGGKTEEPIGGDVLPRLRSLTAEGSMPIQPVRIGRRLLFVDRSRKKVFTLVYDVEQDEFDTIEITGAADHIMGSGVRLGAIGVQRRLDPKFYFVTEGGELVVLTYSFREKVIGFTRFITDGQFSAVAVIPSPTSSGTTEDQVWVIVDRVINGVTKKYIEVFEDRNPSLTREWRSLQTDSAVVKTGVTGTVVTGLAHLEAKTVDVIVNGVFIGARVVTSGQITLTESVTSAEIEVGLHYSSVAETFRPAIEGQVIEGLPRMWTNLSARLRNTRGGKVNGQKIQYAPGGATLPLFSGDRKVYTGGWSTDGSITVEQDEPYPMELLALFGKLQIGDDG